MSGWGRRGQSQTVGVVLILVLTILSVGAIATFGTTAIDRTQQTVDVQSVEHAMSQLDSEASLVALSRADQQSIDLGSGRRGTYTVRPDAGHVTITHLNHTNDGDDEVIYDASLGEVRYRTGETVIAYQGGGVWRKQAGNGSVMVSAPEFHYRQATLTLPIIRIEGDGSVAGAATADISDGKPGVQIYPNRSRHYPITNRPFVNPVQNGTIQIDIQSEYYQGWGAYFRSRTDGNVTVYHENQTARLVLVSTGLDGAFNMPLEGQPMQLRGLGDGHPLDALSVRIYPDQPESQEFAGLSWSLTAEQGSRKFELAITSQSKEGCDGAADVSVYYTNGTNEQGWHADDAFNVTCSDGVAYIDADLVGDTSVQYTDVGTNDLTTYQANGDLAAPVTFYQHAGTVEWEDDGGKTFDVGDTTTLGNATNHYIGLMGQNVDLTVQDGHGHGGGAAGNINEDVSSGFIQYGNTGKFVTYLHVSENNVTVSLR